MDQPIGGSSNTFGFVIYTETKDGSTLTAQNQNFHNKDNGINIFKSIVVKGLSILIELLLMTAMFFAGLFLITKMALPNAISSILSLLALFIFLFLFILEIEPLISSIANQIIYSKQCQQWHYCEHVVIKLLKENKELTPDNFKKTSPLSPLHGENEFKKTIEICKSSLRNIDNLIRLTIVPFWLIFISSNPSFNLLILVALISLIIMLCATIFLEYIHNSLPDFLQKLTLAEPEEWQIEESLKVAEKFKKEYENMYEK